MDTLTTLVARHIEQMINHQDGMDRLGRQKDEHEKRIRDLEIQQAVAKPQVDQARLWIERAIWAAVSILVALVTAKLTGGTVP